MKLHGDFSARIGILNGIGQEIGINLVQAHLIGTNKAMGKFPHLQRKQDVLFLHGRHQHFNHTADHFLQGEISRIEHQLSAFNFGNIQHVVDKGQQLPLGLHGFFETLGCILGVIYIVQRNGGHSLHNVHGGSDVVGHGREELGFCKACLLRLLCCLFQPPVDGEKIQAVNSHQQQQCSADKQHNRPVKRCFQIILCHNAQNPKIGVVAEGRIVPQAVFPPEVFIAENGGIVLPDFFLQGVHFVVIILEIIGTDIVHKGMGFHRGGLNHIVAGTADYADLRRRILHREHPGASQHCHRDDPQQQEVRCPRIRLNGHAGAHTDGIGHRFLRAIHTDHIKALVRAIKETLHGANQAFFIIRAGSGKSGVGINFLLSWRIEGGIGAERFHIHNMDIPRRVCIDGTEELQGPL